MGKLRFFLALWIAKGARLLLRLMGRNATHFPGKVALKLCPDFLKWAPKPPVIIAVTGTNGKTTTCNMIDDILESRGLRVLDNRSGSNVMGGIASCFVTGSSLLGRTKHDVAVLEVDERASPRIYPYVKPDYILITNLFRDSIMRNAHPEYIADILSGAIPEGTKLILNGDDLITCSVAPENERVHFGIERQPGEGDTCINLLNDMQICPVCHSELAYDFVRYHHIGEARCVNCDFRSPARDYMVRDVDFQAMTMSVEEAGEKHPYRLLSDSIFNVYNQAAAISLLRQMGMTHEEIAAAMESIGIVSTRYKQEEVGDVHLVSHMSKEKNALANSRVFDYVAGRPGKKELFMMMNCIGDSKHWSENVCWLYDCDFEFLAKDDITRIVATGPRAKDYVFRLQLAGYPADRIRCEMDEFQATELLAYEPGETVYLFYGTDSLDLAIQVREKLKQVAVERAGRSESDEN